MQIAKNNSEYNFNYKKFTFYFCICVITLGILLLGGSSLNKQYPEVKKNKIKKGIPIEKIFPKPVIKDLDANFIKPEKEIVKESVLKTMELKYVSSYTGVSPCINEQNVNKPSLSTNGKVSSSISKITVTYNKETHEVEATYSVSKDITVNPSDNLESDLSNTYKLLNMLNSGRYTENELKALLNKIDKDVIVAVYYIDKSNNKHLIKYESKKEQATISNKPQEVKKDKEQTIVVNESEINQSVRENNQNKEDIKEIHTELIEVNDGNVEVTTDKMEYSQIDEEAVE